MKKMIKYTSMVVCLGFLIACKDFIVKNIKKKTVDVIAPADNLKVPNNNIVFWWNEVEGAETYNVQIVKPDFNAISQLLVDTNISTTKFSWIFTPGTYQWRVKAVNAGGSTVYTTRSLIIDTTSNLAYLNVGTISPVSYNVTNSKTINFSWNTLGSANSYNLKVYANVPTSTPIIDYTTTNTNYNYTFTTAGVYFWKVNASNAFSNSPYSTPISFKIDLTSPSAPSLTHPLNMSTVKDTSYFRWNYNTGTTDIKYDSLYVALFADSNFTSPTKIYVPRSGTILSNSYPIKPMLTAPTATAGASAYYWWKVKSIDSVGNTSSFTTPFKFKLMN